MRARHRFSPWLVEGSSGLPIFRNQFSGVFGAKAKQANKPNKPKQFRVQTKQTIFDRGSLTTYCLACENHLAYKYQLQVLKGRQRQAQRKWEAAVRKSIKVGRHTDAAAGCRLLTDPGAARLQAFGRKVAGCWLFAACRVQVSGCRSHGGAPGKKTARSSCRLQAASGRGRSLPLAACSLQPILAVCPGALPFNLQPGAGGCVSPVLD